MYNKNYIPFTKQENTNVSNSSSRVDVCKRQLIEIYQDDRIQSVIYPNKSCNNGIQDFTRNIYGVIMNIISSHDMYKTACIGDIKFYSTNSDNLTVYIKDELAMSAIQFPIFIIGDRVLYRGYFIDIVDTNHISICRMDNPYTSKNYYTLQIP